MGCNCRSKQPSVKFGVIVSPTIRFEPTQVTGCFGVAENREGLVYGFVDSAHAQAFRKYLQSTYQVTSRVAKLR